MLDGSIKDIHQVCREGCPRHGQPSSVSPFWFLVMRIWWVWFLTVLCEDKSKLPPALPFESLWKSYVPRVSHLPGGARTSTPHRRFPGNLDAERRGLRWHLGPRGSSWGSEEPGVSSRFLGRVRRAQELSVVMSWLKMGMKIATGTSRAPLKMW